MEPSSTPSHHLPRRRRLLLLLRLLLLQLVDLADKRGHLRRRHAAVSAVLVGRDVLDGAVMAIANGTVCSDRFAIGAVWADDENGGLVRVGERRVHQPPEIADIIVPLSGNDLPPPARLVMVQGPFDAIIERRLDDMLRLRGLPSCIVIVIVIGT